MYIDFDSLGKRIAQRRIALGYKQNELAEKADLSNNYLSNIENGHSIPSLTTFANLCIQLETTPDMLLLGTIKTNDIPQSIIDNIKLCDDNSFIINKWYNTMHIKTTKVISWQIPFSNV